MTHFEGIVPTVALFSKEVKYGALRLPFISDFPW